MCHIVHVNISLRNLVMNFKYLALFSAFLAFSSLTWAKQKQFASPEAKKLMQTALRYMRNDCYKIAINGPRWLKKAAKLSNSDLKRARRCKKDFDKMVNKYQTKYHKFISKTVKNECSKMLSFYAQGECLNQAHIRKKTDKLSFKAILQVLNKSRNYCRGLTIRILRKNGRVSRLSHLSKVAYSEYSCFRSDIIPGFMNARMQKIFRENEKATEKDRKRFNIPKGIFD